MLHQTASFVIAVRVLRYNSLLPARLHLGNKSDLEQERQVQFEEACNLSKDRGILAALETSAKVTGEVTHEKKFWFWSFCYLKFPFLLI